MLLINANEYIKQRNINKAKRYFQLAIKYDSTFSSAYWNYGLTTYGEAKQLEEKMWREKQKAISENEFFTGLTNKKIINILSPSEQNNSIKNNINEIIPSVQRLLTDENLSYTKSVVRNESKQINDQSFNQADLQNEIMEIEKKFEPLILGKIKIYKKYTEKAEQLGIVHEFPTRFFQKQMESIKKFKEKGGY